MDCSVLLEFRLSNKTDEKKGEGYLILTTNS